MKTCKECQHFVKGDTDMGRCAFYLLIGVWENDGTAQTCDGPNHAKGSISETR